MCNMQRRARRVSPGPGHTENSAVLKRTVLETHTQVSLSHFLSCAHNTQKFHRHTMQIVPCQATLYGDIVKSTTPSIQIRNDHLHRLQTFTHLINLQKKISAELFGELGESRSRVVLLTSNYLCLIFTTRGLYINGLLGRQARLRNSQQSSWFSFKLKKYDTFVEQRKSDPCRPTSQVTL